MCPPAELPGGVAGHHVEHLLTHTAGLVNYTDVDEVAAERFFAQIGTRQPSPDQLISTFANQPLEFPPGTAC